MAAPIKKVKQVCFQIDLHFDFVAATSRLGAETTVTDILDFGLGENATKVSFEATGNVSYLKIWLAKRFALDAKLLEIGAEMNEIRSILTGCELIGE